MVLKFYYDLASPPVRAVYFTIKNLDIPVELVNVSLAENQIKSEAYLKVRLTLFSKNNKCPNSKSGCIFLFSKYSCTGFIHAIETNSSEYQ